MANSDFTGVRRRRARLDVNRSPTHPAKSWRNPPRKPCASDANFRRRELQRQFADIIGRLRVIGSVVVTAEVDLRRQNGEQASTSLDARGTASPMYSICKANS
jgi:hypothetical protein